MDVAEKTTEQAESSNIAEWRKSVLSTMSLSPETASGVQEFPLVSIVILNCNGKEQLEKCIAHVEQLTYPYFEILIVDNNSTDESIDFLKSLASEKRIRVLFLTKNKGVAGGRNAAIGSCRGDIVAFLDNDGYPDPNWLTQGVRTLLSKEDIGCVAPLVFLARDPKVLNGAGGSISQNGIARDQHFEVSLHKATVAKEVLYPMGCGMILRKSVVKRIFPLDKVNVRWYDDVEIGFRTWASGHRIVTAPYAWVDHGYCGYEKTNTVSHHRNAIAFECSRAFTIAKYFPGAAARRALLSNALELLSKKEAKKLALCVLVSARLLLHLPRIFLLRKKYPAKEKLLATFSDKQTRSEVSHEQ